MGQFSKAWEDLDFSDNFIFCKVMKDEKLCSELLNILLGFQIEKIQYINTEQQIENFYDAKGIRMDVFLKDSKRVIDLEMQTGNYEDIILRSRYYQSAADVSMVPRRTKYSELKENYIVFICKDDPFGYGIPCYTRTQSFAELPGFVYDDKTHNVFYNSSAFAKAEDKNVRDVLEFIYSLKASSDFTQKLAASVQNAKVKSSFKDEYMYFADILEEEKEMAREAGLAEGRQAGLAEGRQTGLAEGRQVGLAEGRQTGLAEGRAVGLAEGRAVGLAEGIEKEKQETVVRLWERGDVSLETIEVATGLSLEKIKEIIK